MRTLSEELSRALAIAEPWEKTRVYKKQSERKTGGRPSLYSYWVEPICLSIRSVNFRSARRERMVNVRGRKRYPAVAWELHSQALCAQFHGEIDPSALSERSLLFRRFEGRRKQHSAWRNIQHSHNVRKHTRTEQRATSQIHGSLGNLADSASTCDLLNFRHFLSLTTSSLLNAFFVALCHF